jgi:hypothetical protein
MRVLEIKIYGIEEHPNKEKCFDWIRENWHDLNATSVDESIESINALQMKIGGDVDYSISQFPNRGEYITFKNYDKDLLSELDANECPLTGICWDASLLLSMQDNGNADGLMRDLHNDSDYVYSDEGLEELCIANSYEFNELGECI